MTSDPHASPEPPPREEPPLHRPDASAAPTPAPHEKPTGVPFTRAAATWWALIVGSLVLIVLLVFIAQNLDPVTLHFLGLQWDAPKGVAILVAAICGSLITVMSGGVRMLQLRRAAKKNVHHQP
jgi:uncharacterized integral membrane protein